MLSVPIILERAGTTEQQAGSTLGALSTSCSWPETIPTAQLDMSIVFPTSGAPTQTQTAAPWWLLFVECREKRKGRSGASGASLSRTLYTMECSWDPTTLHHLGPVFWVLGLSSIAGWIRHWIGRADPPLRSHSPHHASCLSTFPSLTSQTALLPASPPHPAHEASSQNALVASSTARGSHGQAHAVPH